MGEHRFTAKDATGTAHQYELTLHRGSEGMTTCLQLLALVVEPIAVAVGPLIVQTALSKGVAAVLTNESMMASLDMEALGRGARLALSGAKPALILDVLRYTNRDGQPLVGTDGKATGTFDVAYAKNYFELLTALWEASKANGFFGEVAILMNVASKALRAMPAPPPS